MKLPTLLFSLLITLTPTFTAAARRRSTDAEPVFTTYHAKQLSASPIKLDSTSYDDMTATPRNHSAVIVFTALEPRFGCKICQDFQPEWNILAKSWTAGDKAGESAVLFGTLDFVDGRQIFEALQLQVAPVMLFFPATVGPYAKSSLEPVRFDFTTSGANAEAVHAWLNRQLPAGVTPRPQVRRPFNWVRALTLVTVGLVAVILTTILWPYVLPVMQNRNLWAALSMIAILLFTSGHMFNHIRGTPYVSGDGKGGVSYFAGGFQNQLGIESQIVAAIYAVLAFSTIMLALVVPRMPDPQKQHVAALVWAGVMYGMYSFLLSIFRMKNGGYPYGLPPF